MRYVGLESRRIDYEKDKQNGTNHIEKLIKEGKYDKDYSWSWIILLVIGISLIVWKDQLTL